MIVRQLEDIAHSDRAVDAGDWVSRRLVVARDGVDYSVHDTTMKAGTESHLWYRNHYESAYCLEGEGELRAVADGKTHEIRPGTVYILDRHDEHVLRAKTDLRLVCVFSPALAGQELPDERGTYPLATGARAALRKKNIFVVGLNDFNLGRLQSIRNAGNYDFLRLLDSSDVLEQTHYDLDGMLSKARTALSSFPAPIDGLVHYIDFPVSTTVPILCREFGLPSASLDAVLKCEHKYWSRVEQRKCIGEHIPAFRAFNPFDDDALQSLGMPFPFWVKPIKSFSSYLGFRIGNEEDWAHAIEEIRANIGRFEEPFDRVLSNIDLPAEIANIGGGSCIAEGIIGGRMCTQEGFVHKGEVRVYGTVDSVREPNGSSFARYQYPSTLPASVRKRMTRIVERFMKHIGYDNAPFNVEFFWDANTDHIWLLEINPRISESHSPLFEMVDGASHHEIATDLSLGERPRLPYREGEYACAAKCFIRAYSDGLLTKVPGREELERLEREMPGTIVKILPKAGMRLSELMDQDSYSYTLALIWIGAPSPSRLQKRYERALELLDFEFAANE